MKKLSHKEYFKIYDEKLESKYFYGAYEAPDDVYIEKDLSDLRKIFHKLDKTEDNLSRRALLSTIAQKHRENSDLLRYISKDGRDCLLYCLDNDLSYAVCGPAYHLSQTKLNLALMFYASDFYGSFGIYSDNIPHSSPASSALIYQGKADPHAIIETEMPSVNNKEKKEIVKNTPFMYFLEKNSDRKQKPCVPSPRKFAKFYQGCPFTLKNPQGETLFSLFIKRRLYTLAGELIDLMSANLSPEEMNEAINIRRVDAYFNEANKNHSLAAERSMFIEGNISKTDKIEDSREKMKELQNKIHEAYKNNKAIITENKKAQKAANKKVVELYQPNLFDF